MNSTSEEVWDWNSEIIHKVILNVSVFERVIAHDVIKIQRA